MAGSAEVFAQIQRKPGVIYGALAPNLRGFEDALAAGVKEVAHSPPHPRRSRSATSIARSAKAWRVFAPIMEAEIHGVTVRGYVSCVLGCPYEGEAARRNKWRWLRVNCNVMGCYEVSSATPSAPALPVQPVV